MAALPCIDDRSAAPVIQAVAHAADQAWPPDCSLSEHADLLTTLDNFLRSSPHVTGPSQPSWQ